jgi:hypothetical protein
MAKKESRTRSLRRVDKLDGVVYECMFDVEVARIKKEEDRHGDKEENDKTRGTN